MALLYQSTKRSEGRARFDAAVMGGTAPDKGLFTPVSLPRIHPREIAAMRDETYPEIAYRVTRALLNVDIPDSKLHQIAQASYNFAVPIQGFEGGKYVMRLDQGPTLSFKDFGMRPMAHYMNYLNSANGGEKGFTILGATSGDTGSAAATAFHDLPGVNVVILFPEDGVVPLQRKQITTLRGNVTAIAIDGTFDDCQDMVKKAFADPDLKALNLSSANSMNVGRLLPQTIYYFYAFAKIGGSKMSFAIPSGNFGNATAAIMAKKMGLPVDKLIIAVNENDEFPLFLESGVYSPVPSSATKHCPSNAMDVGHPNNLARIAYFYGGTMDEKGRMEVMPDLAAMRQDIYTISVSNRRTGEVMQEAHAKYGLLLEPHGAVAWEGLERYAKATRIQSPIVALETANPAKFPEEFDRLHMRAPQHETLTKIGELHEGFLRQPNDYGIFKEFLRGQMRRTGVL
jgi:threonine synthase